MSTSGILLISVGLLLFAVLGLIFAVRSRLPALPQWGWRNIISLIAIGAQITAAGVLTAMIWFILEHLDKDADRLVTELVKDPHAAPAVGQVLITIYDAFKTNLLLMTIGLLLIIIGFGFAITARRFSGEWLGGKMDFSGGDDDRPDPASAAANQVAGAAASEAHAITENQSNA